MSYPTDRLPSWSLIRPLSTVWQCIVSWPRLGLGFRWSYGHWLTAYNMVHTVKIMYIVHVQHVYFSDNNLQYLLRSETWENNPVIVNNLVARQNVALIWHDVKISPHSLHNGRPQGHLLISILKMYFLMFSHLPEKQTPYWWNNKQGQMPITCGRNVPVTLTLSYFMFD